MNKLIALHDSETDHFTRTLDRNKGNQFKVTEKLFTYISPIWRR